ncbi:MAG: hypothetical protein QNJ45_07055 [Ardenticatenaceae bacterium]|nr:hypothetical protein [Ardenticatenaceae bacterium]
MFSISTISTYAMIGIVSLTSLGGLLIPDAVAEPTAIIVAQDQPVDQPTPEEREALREILRAERLEAAANLLGMSVEELEAALADGQKLGEMLREADVALEDVLAANSEAIADALDEALAQGLISESEADRIQQHLERKAQRRIIQKGWRSEAKAVVVDILGLTEEEFDAARDAGTTISELAEAQGYTVEEFRSEVKAELKEMREALIEDAVERGIITEEEAEKIREVGPRPRPGQNR